MSSSELRYLIAANELAEQTENVKQTDVANKLRVSKVSTYNAMERLRDKGFIENQAYEDALNATCAFSDATRNGVANFIKSGMADAHHAPIDSDKEQTNDR